MVVGVDIPVRQVMYIRTETQGARLTQIPGHSDKTSDSCSHFASLNNLFALMLPPTSSCPIPLCCMCTCSLIYFPTWFLAWLSIHLCLPIYPALLITPSLTPGTFPTTHIPNPLTVPAKVPSNPAPPPLPIPFAPI